MNTPSFQTEIGFHSSSPLQHLFTIGYRGRNVAGLIEALRAESVQCVADVRFQNWSRTEFGVMRLPGYLRSAGIEYVHLKDLGNRLYKTSGIEIANFDAGETRLLDLLSRYQRVAMLCVCPTNEGCHRSVIVQRMARHGFPQRHI